MRNAIERAILSTLLFRDLSLEADFDKLVDYQIDYELFNSTFLCKATAKAIYNQGDAPYDEETILKYLTKRIDINEAEWIELIKTNSLCYSLLLRYIDELKEMEEEKKMRELRNGR